MQPSGSTSISFSSYIGDPVLALYISHVCFFGEWTIRKSGLVCSGDFHWFVLTSWNIISIKQPCGKIGEKVTSLCHQIVAKLRGMWKGVEVKHSVKKEKKRQAAWLCFLFRNPVRPSRIYFLQPFYQFLANRLRISSPIFFFFLYQVFTRYFFAFVGATDLRLSCIGSLIIPYIYNIQGSKSPWSHVDFHLKKIFLDKFV